MASTPGWTDEEVREFVYAYERQPWGTRRAWLDGQGVSWGRFKRWRNAVFDGDLDRGLIPREGSPMTSPTERRKIAKARERDQVETEQLRARVRELEQANEALGKAIGLLHQLNVEEPATPETSEPNDSSGKRTHS
jgi:hypothetical protein